MLWVALHFPGLAPTSLEPIAAWACQFTPKVSLEPPDALLVEVEGSLRYFGGEEALAAALEGGLADMQVEAACATAPTPRAALWRARGGGLPLTELPLSAMRVEEDFFRSIGVATVGEVLELPRDGLAERCGQGLVDELDRALGRMPEPREFFSPPERFAASLELPAEVSQAEALLFAARRLLVQLDGLLAARQAGVRAFTLELAHRDGTTSAVTVELASAARDAERFCELLREKLGGLQLAQPVEGIAVRAADFAPLGAQTQGLFGDSTAEAEDWARLLERLQARLGREAVHGVSPFPDHRPEYAWRRIEPGDWDAHEFVQPGPRPCWLLNRPRAVNQDELQLVAGPERIACGWWDGDEAHRDYFVAQAGAALAWVYREDGCWYLHGLFA
jgi:protein ImuB